MRSHSTRDSTPSSPPSFAEDWVAQQIAAFEAGEEDGNVTPQARVISQ